jgi:hypothetical protein
MQFIASCQMGFGPGVIRFGMIGVTSEGFGMLLLSDCATTLATI